MLKKKCQTPGLQGGFLNFFVDSYVKIAFYFPTWYNKMTYDYFYVPRGK